MDRAASGIIAGLAATMVMSVIMVAKGMLGLIPELDVVAMLGSMMNTSLAMAWVIHFMIGMLAWGVGFVFFFNVLPGGSNLGKGISFGIAAWFLMMVVLMPLAGAGLFGIGMGLMASIMTLMLHAIYGAVLGLVFGRLGKAQAATAPATANSA